MQGPRPIRADEFPSLSRLVDSVFQVGDAPMLTRFPLFFHPSNIDNLFVMVDDGRIVSHAGMMLHRAIIGGCRIRVACFGAVATDPAYRNRGLASALYEAAREAALENGADIMLISGGLDLYRRAGSNDCGLNRRAVITKDQADTLRRPDVHVQVARDSDVPEIDAVYTTRQAHFVRAPEEWAARLACGYCFNRRSTPLIVRDRGQIAAYLVVSKPGEDGRSIVGEFAGSPESIVAALPLAVECTGADELEFEVQQEDTPLRLLLEEKGIAFEMVRTTDTVLILNPGQLVRKLQPYMEEQIGVMDAERISMVRYGESYRFAVDGTVRVSCSLEQLPRFVFGHPDEFPADGLLGDVFPIPNLWYGYNYV